MRSYTDIGRYLVVAIIVLIAIAGCMTISWGRDLGQWANTDPKIKEWYRSLMQPDNPAVSCCGESDAYWCDDIGSERVKDPEHPGEVKIINFCMITDDRDDAPLRRKHRDIGTRFDIPDHKMKWGPNDQQPRKDWTTGNPVELNPTNHAIIFLSSGDFVYCFVPGVLM